VDSSGAPVAKGSVSFLVGGDKKLSCGTDDDGRFTLSGLPRSDVTLVVTNQAGGTASVTVLAATTEIADIVLSR
jgi:hypothetical protein